MPNTLIPPAQFAKEIVALSKVKAKEALPLGTKKDRKQLAKILAYNTARVFAR